MIEIKEAAMGAVSKDFFAVVDDIYRDDPQYVRPLDRELKDRLDPRKNPFFEHGEGACFTAHRDGRCVGRITAQLDRAHLERYRDDTGFFGLFDTIDDPEVATALLGRACAWLEARGMTRARGPVSLSINEELGCLVEGFDTPPYVLMPHHRPYQGGLIEQAGFAKTKDVYAWKYQVGELNPRTRRAHEALAKRPEVTTRTLEMKRVQHDVELIMEIFNDAWSDNWGFVALTRREVHKMAQDFKLILVPEMTRIVSIDGEPAAVALAVPNLNAMIGDLRGKLGPIGLARLLWRLKVRGPRSARLVILGIRKKYRHVRTYMGLSAYLYAEMHDAGKRLGITEGELSWTLEDNGRINAGIHMMGGERYKTYRVYEKAIGRR
jgi:hypothetical protein